MKTQLGDQYGFSVECTPMDELRVAEATRIVGTTFTGTTIDTNFWTPTLANNGTAAQANNKIVLGSSTTINGSSILQSVTKGRYVASISNRFRAEIQLSFPITGNTRRWGAFDGTDGCYFELSGLILSACIMKAGVRTVVARLVRPNTDINNYEIYISSDKAIYVINGTLVATYIANTDTYCDTLTLPLRIDNVNTGNVTNSTLAVRSATITRLGKLETAPIYKNITGVSTSQILKYGAGIIHSIIVGTSTSGATISIYDNTTGTSNPVSVITLATVTAPVTLDFHVGFSTGLNVVPSQSSLNLTVIYE